MSEFVNVFTYGSLMFPDVWSRVVEGTYRRAPAIADGYQRRVIAHERYPGMVAASIDAQLEGVVYFDVSAADIAALDAYEGDEYQRIQIEVALTDEAMIQAQAYLYLRTDKVVELIWEPENFETSEFIDSYWK